MIQSDEEMATKKIRVKDESEQWNACRWEKERAKAERGTFLLLFGLGGK